MAAGRATGQPLVTADRSQAVADRQTTARLLAAVRTPEPLALARRVRLARRNAVRVARHLASRTAPLPSPRGPLGPAAGQRTLAGIRSPRRQIPWPGRHGGLAIPAVPPRHAGIRPAAGPGRLGETARLAARPQPRRLRRLRLAGCQPRARPPRTRRRPRPWAVTSRGQARGQRPRQSGQPRPTWSIVAAPAGPSLQRRRIRRSPGAGAVLQPRVAAPRLRRC